MGRIALYGAGGSPYHHAAILGRDGHDLRFVFPVDIQAGALESFDAFVMPGGGYRAMAGQLEPLGVAGCRAIREYVESGGMYIGSCAGSYDAAVVPARFLDMCPEQAEMCMVDARVWNHGESMFGVLQSPGIGELVAETLAPDHPVMTGLPAQFRVTHYNGPLFTGGTPLARVVGTTEQFTPAEEFLGASDGPRLIDRAIEAGVNNVVAGQHGHGRVVLFGSHPEFGSSLTMDDVGEAAALLRNAVAWQLSAAHDVARPTRTVLTDAQIPTQQRERDLASLTQLVDRLTRHCADLDQYTERSAWLAPAVAMSMFGRSAREVWAAALQRIPELAAQAAAAAPSVAPALLSFRPTGQAVDGGFHGVAPLLVQADELLVQAAIALEQPAPPAVEDPYGAMRESPYHLVAGSYLAAVGRVTSASLLTRMSGNDRVLAAA